MNEKKSDTKPESTRRQFVKKLKWVAPAIWTLAATPKQALAGSAPASGTCAVSGQECDIDDDCCTFNCVSEGGMMMCVDNN